MTNSIKVAFFSHSANLYGAERSLFDIVNNLPEKYNGSFVILPRRGGLSSLLDANRIPYVVCPFYGWLGSRHKNIKGQFRKLYNFFYKMQLAKLIRFHNINVIYTNTLYSPIGALVASKLNLPHVWHFREFVEEDMRAEFDDGLKNAMDFCDSNSDYVIFNSYALKDKFDSFLNKPIKKVIYNGWLDEINLINKNTKKNYDITKKNSPLNLCIVGSIHNGKGQVDAIKVLHSLTLSGLESYLYIVGSGDKKYILKLKNLAVKLNISNKILWVGFSTNVSSYFQKADIILVCSRCEAFGRIVVEAMAEGCLVIATNSGGIPEIIDHKKNGLLYNPGDIEALHENILLIHNNPKLSKSISAQAKHDSFSRFGLNRYVFEICNILGAIN